jgi:hypothetical protein
VRTPGEDVLKGTQGAVEGQLAYSRDGRHFIRVGERAPFLPVGAPGDWDDGRVYPSGAIVRDNEIWIYYGGWGARHTGSSQDDLGKVIGGRRRMAAVGLARMRLDGFVSLRAGGAEGLVLTRQVLVRGEHLRLNANALSGTIAVEVLDPTLRPIPGFARGDSVPIRTDSVSTEVRWRERPDLRSLRGRAVRFRFYMSKADLYSMQLK